MSNTTDHKEGKASVKAIYFTSKTLADGSHPFMLRITKDRKRKYISTGITLHPDHWNDTVGTFRKSVPKAKREEIEAALSLWEAKYRNAAEQLADADQEHNAKDVASKVSTERISARKYKLLAYFDELISQLERTGSVGNRKVYRDVQNNLRRYIGPDNDISFDQISVKFCNEWENKMRAEGLTEVTLSVKFRTLRAVFNKAIANGYAKTNNYPFARNTAEVHKFHVGKFDTRTKKRAISKEFIRLIEVYQPPYDIGKYANLRNTQKRMQLAKDVFLFSYYCGGINFIDMTCIKWSNIVKDLNGRLRLEYIRRKNGKHCSVPLQEPALNIINFYKASNQFNLFIFPILHSKFHITPQQIQNRSEKVLSKLNSDLKVIGTSLNIKTPLTSYVARHTFATVLRRSGVPTPIISESLKHSDERTTQIYLSEFDTEELDAAFIHL